MPESPTSTPFIKFTKSFKKYKAEYAPAAVDYVRSWARTETLLAVHEDASLIKVTGSELQIKTLLATLKERFNYIPPEDLEDAKPADDSADES